MRLGAVGFLERLQKAVMLTEEIGLGMGVGVESRPARVMAGLYQRFNVGKILLHRCHQLTTPQFRAEHSAV